LDGVGAVLSAGPGGFLLGERGTGEWQTLDSAQLAEASRPFWLKDADVGVSEKGETAQFVAQSGDSIFVHCISRG